MVISRVNSLASQIANGGSNNLNAIRLMLALAVILSHAQVLSIGFTKGEPLFTWTHEQETFGTVAVDLFFFISGMLITASWFRSKSMNDYLMKRVLRIYPGFVTAVLFTGAIIWVLFPEFRANAGHGLSWLETMVEDCVFLTRKSLVGWHWTGIFPDNPDPNDANESLWTIPYEFSCYFLILWLGLFCLLKYRRLILASFLCIFLFNVVKSNHAEGFFSGNNFLPSNCRFLTYFLAGTCTWLWRDKILFSWTIALGCLITLLVASQFTPWFSVIFPFTGSYLILWLGFGPKLRCLDWTNRTDLSYGIYLYAWPIQQIVAMHRPLRHPWLNFLISTPVALFFAWLSWNFVEKKFLAKKNVSVQDFDPGDSDKQHLSRAAMALYAKKGA